MKSGRWHKLTQTFRFRLAMLHVLMVSGALAVTFLITLSFARSSAISSSRKSMAESLHHGRGAYLGRVGEVKAAQLPEEMLARIEQQFEGLHIGMVEREVQPEGILYEMIASTGREWMEILADPHGKAWVADRKPIAEIFAMMADSVRAGGRANLELFVYTPKGELLAGTSSSSPKPGDLEGFLKDEQRLYEPLVVKEGAGLAGGIRLFDGNVLFARNRMEEIGQITHRSARFFFMLMAIFIPLSVWIGFHLSKKAMAGVERVTEVASRVRAGNFSARVSASSEGTEIQALVESFNAMVSRIEVLMQELRDVTANIAHDLKTPVTRMRGLLESMGWEEVSSGEREQIIASAMEECDRIMPLVDSVLELSRAEAGMLVLQLESFDLSGEVQTAHAIFSTLAEDRAIAFELEAPENAVPMVGDRSRMQRVVANLIDNAFKFTPEGGRVLLRLEATPNQAIITVSDNGPGIPKSELENVFKRFYRLDPSRATPGHGMGLSMVRAFVNAFGGSVSIESDAGKGCSVIVVVPTHADKGESGV
jgi:signal transduction histidine kinase